MMAAQAHAGGNFIPNSAVAEMSAPPKVAGVGPANVPSLSTEVDPPDRLYGEAVYGPWHCAFKYAAAGTLFALIISAAGLWAFSQNQINPLGAADHPLQFLFMFWMFAWPIVVTTNVVAAATLRDRWLISAVYFAVLATFGALLILTPTEALSQFGGVSLPAWSGETPVRLLGKWSLFNLAPTLLIIVFRNRRLGAIAPLFLAFMTVLSTGLLIAWIAIFAYRTISEAVITFLARMLGVSDISALIGYFLILGMVACLAFGMLGWWLLLGIRRSYQRKTMSDQSLTVDAIWLLYGSFYAMILAFGGPGWSLAAIVAFVIFKIAARIANKFFRPHASVGPALLVLRVFSLGRRSEVLFEAVTKRWRHLGTVQLIAGTDLASSTVAPHQFLAFLTGKLHRMFIDGEMAIDRGMRELDNGRDADGRFRTNDFYCHADTWQQVLSRLVAGTDVVLMDLRSFSNINNGCLFEINELINAVPLRRLVFVIDATTDREFLRQALEDCSRNLGAASPNRGVSPTRLRLIELASLTHRELKGLVRRLCAAVGDTQQTAH